MRYFKLFVIKKGGVVSDWVKKQQFNNLYSLRTSVADWWGLDEE